MKELICLLFNHKYRLLRKINSQVRELYCSRCARRFAMNDSLKALLPLDGEFIDLHNDLIQIEERKKELSHKRQAVPGTYETMKKD